MTMAREGSYKLAGFLVAALLSVSVVVASTLWKHGPPNLYLSMESCDAWERAASARVATLREEGNARAELRFNEALAQLRRAHRYCQAGYTAVAESDFRALERAIPDRTTTSSVSKQ